MPPPSLATLGRLPAPLTPKPLTITHWAQEALEAARRGVGVAAPKQGIENLPGFHALEPEDREILVSIARGDGFRLDHEDDLSLLRAITGEGLLSRPFKGPFGGIGRAVAELAADPHPPIHFFPPAGRRLPRFLPGTPHILEQKGGSIIGTVVNSGLGILAEEFGLNRGEEPFRNVPGIAALYDTRQVPRLPDVRTVEEGRRLLEENHPEEIRETEDYYKRQLSRMTKKERRAYLEAAEAVARSAETYQDKVGQVLRVCREAGGRPAPERLDRAKGALEQAICEDPYLSDLKIDPRRFRLLEARHKEETWRGSEKGKEFLRRRALAVEGEYVYDTLAGRATLLRNEGASEEEWRHYDELAARSKGVYERLVQGDALLGTDGADLEFFRRHLIDHPIEWNKVGRRVKESQIELREAMRDYAEAVKEYHGKVGHEIWEWDRLRLALSQERDRIDIEFQGLRLREQFDRLEGFVKDRGGAIEPDHRAYFDAWMAELNRKVPQSREFTKSFLSGEDAEARENKRNSMNKGVARVLALRLNLALEDMYRHYHFTTEEGRPGRPSWISFGYNGLIRAVDEAVEADSITGDHIRSYLDDFLRRTLDVIRELVPGKIGWHREAPDRAYIHQLETLAGSGSRNGEDGRLIVYGLGGKTALLRESPHPALRYSDPQGEIYRPGFFGVQQHYPLSILWTANHIGNTEFRLFLTTSLLGLRTPQIMQGGAANVPIAGAYGKVMSGVLDRSKGSDAIVHLLLDNLLRDRVNGFFRSGTRNAADVAFHLFRAPRREVGGEANYSELHAFRVTTDFATTGLDAKIAKLYREASADTDEEMFLLQMVHEGSVKEPTWNLDDSASAEGILGAVADNLAADTGFNVKRNRPWKLAFTHPYPSRGFLTEDEIRRLDRDRTIFRTSYGVEMSAREAYFRTLQFNSVLLQWDQEMAAAGMDIAPIPDRTDAQTDLRQRALSLPPDQQLAETAEPVYEHMKERLETVGQVPRLPPGRQPLPDLSQETEKRLESILSKREASRLIADFPKQKGPRAFLFLIEMAQRGAAYGKRMAARGRKTAFDGDGVLWDHVFEAAPGEIPGAAREQIVDWLSQRGTTEDGIIDRLSDNRTVNEWINIFPAVVAFLLGYRRATGSAPVLFSSTLEPRLRALALAAKENPLARGLFKALLGEDFAPLSHREIGRRVNAAIVAKKIITRGQIAEYVVSLMKRYRAAGFHPGLKDAQEQPVFTKEERHDIRLILENGGDVHIKYRGLYPYDEIVDDRRQNVQAAVSSGAVRAYQPERFTNDPLSLYVAFRSGGSLPHSHADQRLNQGRDGTMVHVLRDMEEASERPALIRYDRRRRPKKVDGLVDQPLDVGYRRRDVRKHYQKPAREAERAAASVLIELKARARAQEEEHREKRRRLAGIYAGIYNGPSVSEPAFDNNLWKYANRILAPEDGSYPAIAKEAQWNTIEAPIRTMRNGPPKEEAEAIVRFLKGDRLSVDQVAALDSKKKGAGSPGGTLASVARGVPRSLAYLFNVLQHLMGGSIDEKLPTERARWLLYPLLHLWPRNELLLLLKLGRSLTGKKIPEKTLARAYGVAVKRLGVDLALRALDFAIQDETLDDKTRRRLAENRLDYERRIRKAGDDVKNAVTKSGFIYLLAKEVGGHVADAAGTLEPIWGDGVGDASIQLLRGVFRTLFNEIRERRLLSGLTPAEWGSGDGFLLADRALWEGMILAGGQETFVGGVLLRARIRLHELGFEPALERLTDLLNDLSGKSLQFKNDLRDVASRNLREFFGKNPPEPP